MWPSLSVASSELIMKSLFSNIVVMVLLQSNTNSTLQNDTGNITDEKTNETEPSWNPAIDEL